MSCDLLIEVESIDELTIDATTCDEEIAISIADVEEVSVEAFDYPPEIEQLSQELAAQMEAIGSNASAIAALQGDVAALDERVVKLEDNVIADITLSSNVIALDINLPTLEYDIEIEVNYTSNVDLATQYFRVNGVIGSNYVMATSQSYLGFISYSGRHASKGIYRLTLIDGFIFCQTSVQQIWGTDSVQNVNNRITCGYLKVVQQSINLISFEHQINANSRFIIRRVKKHG